MKTVQQPRKISRKPPAPSASIIKTAVLIDARQIKGRGSLQGLLAGATKTALRTKRNARLKIPINSSNS